MRYGIVLSRANKTCRLFCRCLLCTGTTVAILTFLILVGNLCVRKFAIQRLPWSNRYIQDFVHFFIIAITVLVVAVPEGLPLAVTISLAYAVRVRSVQCGSNLARIKSNQSTKFGICKAPLKQSSQRRLLYISRLAQSVMALSPGSPALNSSINQSIIYNNNNK